MYFFKKNSIYLFIHLFISTFIYFHIYVFMYLFLYFHIYIFLHFFVHRVMRRACFPAGIAIIQSSPGVNFEATVTLCGPQTKYKKCSLHEAPVDSVG